MGFNFYCSWSELIWFWIWSYLKWSWRCRWPKCRNPCWRRFLWWNLLNHDISVEIHTFKYYCSYTLYIQSKCHTLVLGYHFMTHLNQTQTILGNTLVMPLILCLTQQSNFVICWSWVSGQPNLHSIIKHE